jgi:hypothetical protein
MTACATRETFLILRTPPTDPARRVVGQATETDAVLVRIILRAFYNFQHRIERIAAIFKEGEGILQIIESIARTNNNRPFAG